MKKEVSWICSDCGRIYGDYSVGCSSWTVMNCEVCGEEKGCTEPRDFGYIPRFKGSVNLKAYKANRE